eukprot:743083-Pyramimonas_sp.AAC.1
MRICRTGLSTSLGPMKIEGGYRLPQGGEVDLLQSELDEVYWSWCPKARGELEGTLQQTPGGLKGGQPYDSSEVPLGELLCTRRNPTRSLNRALHWLGRRCHEIASLVQSGKYFIHANYFTKLLKATYRATETGGSFRFHYPGGREAWMGLLKAALG